MTVLIQIIFMMLFQTGYFSFCFFVFGWLEFKKVELYCPNISINKENVKNDNLYELQKVIDYYYDLKANVIDNQYSFDNFKKQRYIADILIFLISCGTPIFVYTIILKNDFKLYYVIISIVSHFVVSFSLDKIFTFFLYKRGYFISMTYDYFYEYIAKKANFKNIYIDSSSEEMINKFWGYYDYYKYAIEIYSKHEKNIGMIIVSFIFAGLPYICVLLIVMSAILYRI